ncbi:MAG: archaeosine biosynthesis radical SAM protein RaSEA [Candidatus Hodarchaeales archaeon]|jgi:radical SAM enzyme (TIGR01210 family)
MVKISEIFRIGDNIRSIRHKGFKNRKRKTKIFSKIEKTTLSKPVSTEKSIKALTMVIPTIGCSWALSKSGGCSMCGYINDSTLDSKTNPEFHFLQEWEKYHERMQEIESVKLYNSGSFLDPKEIPFDSQKRIVAKIAEYPNICELVIESLPELVNKHLKVLKELVNIFGGRPILVGLGLESSNDYINRSYVNKSFYFKQFVKCVKNIYDVGAIPKAYLLLKPPFLTEKEAIEDAVQSIKDTFSSGCKVVSLNPVVIHADTLVDQMYKRDEYQPPWLWSVLEVLKRVHPFKPKDGTLICEVIAGGKERGAHNCGLCDMKVLQEIEYYSLYNKFSPVVDKLDCIECKSQWQFVIDNEGLFIRLKPILKKSFKNSEKQAI